MRGREVGRTAGEKQRYNKAAKECGRARTPVPTLVYATALLANGKGLMLALASGLSGSGVARGLDFRRTSGGGSSFGGVGGILACLHVSGSVPIHIAFGHMRLCSILLVPVVLGCLLTRGLRSQHRGLQGPYG